MGSETSEPLEAESLSEPTAAEQSSTRAAPVGEAPVEAGKLILPDLTPMTIGQGENIAAMTAISKSASENLQKIVVGQQAMLKSALSSFQASLKESSSQANIPSGQVPDLQVNIDNLKLSVDNFSATAETITATNAVSVQMLTEAVNKSFNKIVETAEKFSGG